MGNKLVWHQVVLFGLMALISVLRWLAGVWGLDLNLVWWWLGGVLGFLFVFSDRLVHALVTNPEEILSLKIKQLFAQRKLVGGLALALDEREKQKNLVMRSALFLVVWLVLAIWTVTSVAGWFPRGLIFGLGTHLTFDLLWDYFLPGGRKAEEWFWQIKRKLSPVEVAGFVYLVGTAYLVLVWFL